MDSDISANTDHFGRDLIKCSDIPSESLTFKKQDTFFPFISKTGNMKIPSLELEYREEVCDQSISQAAGHDWLGSQSQALAALTPYNNQTSGGTPQRVRPLI